MSDGKVVGAIPQKSPEQQAADAKRKQYKKLSMDGDDVMYVADEMAFYCHGKHSSIVNVECVVRLQVSDLIIMFAPLFAQVLLPMTVAAQEQMVKKSSPIVKS